MTAVARLEAQQLHPDRELARFTEEAAGAGAIVSFIGLARPRSKAGDDVTSLFLDHYPGMTERSLQEIADAGLGRFDVTRILVVHRCGAIAPKEPIVFVAAASLHRRAAFQAADYVMDRLKTEAMFWKKEHGLDGGRWIEPSDQDRADLARWSS
jgi:molybdopterin synthase catalytic subunit